MFADSRVEMSVLSIRRVCCKKNWLQLFIKSSKYNYLMTLRKATVVLPAEDEAIVGFIIVPRCYRSN